VDNIEMDLGEIIWGGVDWIGLAQDRDKLRALVTAVMNFGFHKMLRNYTTGGHSSMGSVA
jgi:hypothetical protein